MARMFESKGVGLLVSFRVYWNLLNICFYLVFASVFVSVLVYVFAFVLVYFCREWCAMVCEDQSAVSQWLPMKRLLQKIFPFVFVCSARLFSPGFTTLGFFSIVVAFSGLWRAFQPASLYLMTWLKRVVQGVPVKKCLVDFFVFLSPIICKYLTI